MESNNVLKKSLLLIPDISGFTKFVNETEIVHGVHIISELLEKIIENNTLGLKVAEIEGDAVLFYKYTEKPSLKDLYKQCKLMFLAFHQNIKLYERDRICDCGSCSSTPDLTLKFIIHYGSVIERNILGHFQLMGADVTTAHKLMKNNVDKDEYILISNNSFVDSGGLPNWFKLQANSMEYKDVGKISYQYEYLTNLHSEIPPLPDRPKVIDEPVQLTLEHSVPFNIDKAFALISSLPRKHEWLLGVKEIKFDSTKVERIGSEHECVTSLNTLHIETIQNEMKDNEMVFAEKTAKAGIFPASDQIYTLSPTGENSCNIKIDVRFKKTLFSSIVFKRLLKKALLKALTKFNQVLSEDEKINN